MAIDPQAALADEPLRRYDRFVALVSELASLSLPEAELAVQAVVETMAEHLSDDQRREFASRLPKAGGPGSTNPGGDNFGTPPSCIASQSGKESPSQTTTVSGSRPPSAIPGPSSRWSGSCSRPTRSTPSRSGSPRRRASCCVRRSVVPPSRHCGRLRRACGGDVPL